MSLENSLNSIIKASVSAKKLKSLLACNVCELFETDGVSERMKL